MSAFYVCCITNAILILTTFDHGSKYYEPMGAVSILFVCAQTDVSADDNCNERRKKCFYCMGDWLERSCSVVD